MKKCRCGNEFFQYNSVQSKCVECLVKIGKMKVKKETKLKEALQTQKMRDKVQTLSDVKKKLQSEINAIVRQIDKDHPCMSCGSCLAQFAGHYHSRGSNSSIAFNLFNIFRQCFSCNEAKSGNLHEYDLGLIKTFGKEKWEYIKFDLVRLYPELKLSKEEIKEKIKLARAILRELKAENKIYDVKERWQIRLKVNEKIGIYQTK